MSSSPIGIPPFPFGENLPPATGKGDNKPMVSWGQLYRTDPLVLVALAALIIGPVLGLSAGVASLFISQDFCISVIAFAVASIVIACGYMLARRCFPADKSVNGSLPDIPNAKLGEKSQRVLDEFLAEEIKVLGDGEKDADVHPARSALKEYLEKGQEDSARIGLFLLANPGAKPEKICQFFDTLGEMDEAKRVEVIMAAAKVKTPSSDIGQYVPMGPLAVTHEDPVVREKYFVLLDRCTGDNLYGAFRQLVQWPGLPGGYAPFGLFVASRELQTEERVKFLRLLSSKLDADKLGNIKTADGWPILWSFLLFGDKEPDGFVVRNYVITQFFPKKEGFEVLLQQRPGKFSKADETTHPEESARDQLNTRMDAMLQHMNDYMRKAAQRFALPYCNVVWTS
ncbi:MAG: hypothetical protein LBI34_04140 [Puniceicoccales bacterium]|jgi:hypothetical protein|nr:hypothetical protein [Puniceicoccales bacterium]